MMYGRHILLGCAERPGAESRVVLRVSRFIVAQGSIMAQRIRSSSSATCPQDSSIDRRTVIARDRLWPGRSEEHTSELQSLMRISYAVFCLQKKQLCTT